MIVKNKTTTLFQFMKYFIISCVLATCAVSLFVLVFGIIDVLHPPEIGENVSQVEWLPAEATDISYFQDGSLIACEFIVLRNDEWEWRRIRGWV